MLIHYKFNGNFQDSSENGFNGINFGVTFTEDRFGNENSAAHFNGINNYISFPNTQELKPELPVSFSFWVKYDELEWNYSSVFRTSYEEDVCSGIFFNTDVSGHRYSINYGDGGGVFNSTTPKTYLSNLSIDTGEWHSVVAVIEGPQNMKIYIDCRENGGIYNGSGGNLHYSMTPGVIGRGDRYVNQPGDYFKGSLDDFKYWNRVILEEEVSYLCTENPMNVRDFTINNLSIYPNPSDDVIYINAKSNNIYAIYQEDGRRILYGNLNDNSVYIGKLNKGIYYIKIFDDGVNKVGRFIKK